MHLQCTGVLNLADIWPMANDNEQFKNYGNVTGKLYHNSAESR